MYLFKRVSLSLRSSFKDHVKRYLTSEGKTDKTSTNPVNEKSIIVSRTGQITLICINRPEKKNALDTVTTQLLCDALDEFEKDERAIVGVLHGAGGNFCAGFDLHEIANCNEEKEDKLPQFGALANRNELTKKPLVAALSGYALDAGLELALMCDLRVIEENAVVGFFNRRFGIPILCGGTVRLPAIIGYGRAMDMVLTGKPIDGKSAYEMGLATKCTEGGTAIGLAVKYAQSLVKFPQKTLLADRTSLHYATFSGKPMDEALQFERDNASHLLLEEGIKGAKLFIQKGIGRHGKFYNLTEKDKTIKELNEKLL